MSNPTDIVERLRDTGCDREPFTPEHAGCICRLATEAANEIERLRSALEDCGNRYEALLLQLGAGADMLADREQAEYREPMEDLYRECDK